MEPLTSSRFLDHFASVSDPRGPNIRHPLFDIFVIARCAVISGAEGWEDMEEYGQAQADWFEQFLDLPHGIPSPDTFRRVLSRLRPEELTQCFINSTDSLRESLAGEIVAIEGKTLRRSFDRAVAKGALHMISAWVSANRLVLGQLKVEDIANEIAAIPHLLGLLELDGATVTIDAMGCQKEIARTIAEQGADDVLALKDNQATLHGEVKLLFDTLTTVGLTDVSCDHYHRVEADQGRMETRRYWLTSDIECLGAKGSWANLAGIDMVESQVELDDVVSCERRYFLTSVGCDAARFAQAVRQHWVLDVSFREDDCRIRQDAGAQTMPGLRQITLNLIRRESSHKRGVKARRKRAGWDHSYLLQILTG